jgi:hypothetical protein
MDEAEKYFKDWIKKITYLEKKLGDKVSYKPLEPFPININSIVDIQKAGRKIADFLGLKGLTFVITKIKQKDKVGGNVELEYMGKDVFVEISNNVGEFEESVLATLAHEITHKYMHMNNISSGYGKIHEYENEIFTDITAVYLGLGKLMIDGCEVNKTSTINKKGETYEQTKKLQVGYLKRDELGFVYRLVCAMRGISNKVMLSNLTYGAKSAIKQWSSYDGIYFNSKFREAKFNNEIKKTLKKDIALLQDNLNEANDLLKFLEEDYIKKGKDFLKLKKNKIASLRKDLTYSSKDKIYNPSLRFLDAISVKEWGSDTRNNLQDDIKSVVQINQELTKIKKNIQKENTFKSKLFSLLRIKK